MNWRSPAKLLGCLRLVPVIASCSQPGLLPVLCSLIHSIRSLQLNHALTHHHIFPPSLAAAHPPPPSLPLTCSYTHPNLITSSTDQGASCACRDSMASQPISDAWHSPASDRQCRQDSTALLWRGQTVGLPAGDLPSSIDRSWLMTYIKLQCCQVVCLKRACPDGSLLLHDFIDVLLCLDKQPCSSAIDCTKHMTADPLFSAGQQQAVSVYT